MYEIIQVVDGNLIGGHYAVRECPSNRVIGKEFKLDKECAKTLALELNKALRVGREIGKRDNLLHSGPRDGQRAMNG